MNTTITIDDALIEQAAKLADTQNQNQLIELALSEFIQHRQQPKKRDLRDLVGKVRIDPEYDYKKLRIGEQ